VTRINHIKSDQNGEWVHVPQLKQSYFSVKNKANINIAMVLLWKSPSFTSWRLFRLTEGELSMAHAAKQHFFVVGNQSSRWNSTQKRRECATHIHTHAQKPEVDHGILTRWDSSANHCATVPHRISRYKWAFMIFIFVGKAINYPSCILTACLMHWATLVLISYHCHRKFAMYLRIWKLEVENWICLFTDCD